MMFKISSEKIEEFIEEQHSIDGMVSMHDFELWLEEQPRVGEWIPVSERLPEERGNYLATIKVEAGTFVIYVWFGEEGWIDGYSEPINVIAWMPIPPAFEGE